MAWSRLGKHVRANAVGYVALFVALGGTAAATIHLPSGSVGTSQLKNGAVTGRKVAHDTLTGANIKASTLGEVPSAADAHHADTSDLASNATELGGSPAAAFQSRVSGACSSGTAVQSIGAGGTVACGTLPPSGVAGGDLTGTFPAPTIAPGAITTADFASGATAPDAGELGGFAPSAYFPSADVNEISFNPTCTTSVGAGCTMAILTLGGETLGATCGNGMAGSSEIDLTASGNATVKSTDFAFITSGSVAHGGELGQSGLVLDDTTSGEMYIGTIVVQGTTYVITISLEAGASDVSPTTSSCQVDGTAVMS